MKKSELKELIKEAYGSLKEGEDYFDHYKDDLIFTVANLDVARDLYKKAYKYGFVSDHYFDNDIRYGNTTGSDIIVFPASVNDLPNSAGKLIKIIGKEPITIEGWEDIVTESVNEVGVDISLGIGVMDKVKELYQNKDIQGLKDFRQRFDYPKASMKIKKLVPVLIDDLAEKLSREKGLEEVNEDIQPLAVEELTDEALTRLRDQFLTTGTRPNEAEMALLKSVLDEMNKRGLEESINEILMKELF